MSFSKTLLVSLLLAASSTVLASPAMLESRGIQVGYGQQIQTSDQANHWVVWIEGQSACPATQTLSGLNTSPCNQVFTLAGGTYQLTNCNGNNEPQAVADQDGNYIHTCTLNHDKINCHHGEHDIVKHGKCT
ncbi:hypothetical protein M406DRAFT_351297 [Cryphonectria parasitica EP155]|uniref:Uncharacterized protein n=1 Tax=Cryphonectria parasitica (strain ATCC 38755 / EP155) TaxID=660469 RepID=A0A9P4Y3X6_CRYP1|nr:uncharacterized protein M406DRAFT_351297 [Cryphonectria parasitica EP155]KAF3766049.1 hypothetical protein M406DRAFT_351297 [Cryphonectria parasitica EP155]